MWWRRSPRVGRVLRKEGGSRFLRLCLADTPDHFTIIRALSLSPSLLTALCPKSGGHGIDFTTLRDSSVLRLSLVLLKTVEGRLLPSLDYLSGRCLGLCLFHFGVKECISSNVQMCKPLNE